jgi:hypothetical protein
MNIPAWIDKVMTAKSEELPKIKAAFEKALAESERDIEDDLEVTSKIMGEKSVHPQVILQKDWLG